jgi:hypothetical protein
VSAGQLHLPKGALLNDAGISVRLGQKIMGKVHADTPCVLRRPEYNKDGWFSIGGVDFVQLCLGEHAVKSEEFMCGVLEEARAHPGCWTKTGPRDGKGATRQKGTMEAVRQCAAARGGVGIAHMCKQGFNFLSGFPGWTFCCAAYMYLLQDYMVLHCDNPNDKHGGVADENYTDNTRMHGFYRMLWKCQELGKQSCLLLEDGAGAGTFTLWILSGSTIVSAPNLMWDTRGHAALRLSQNNIIIDADGGEALWTFTGLITFEGCPNVFLKKMQEAFAQGPTGPVSAWQPPSLLQAMTDDAEQEVCWGGLKGKWAMGRRAYTHHLSGLGDLLLHFMQCSTHAGLAVIPMLHLKGNKCET